MTKSKGANLIEYILPIALIALVAGGGLFYMFSNKSLLGFSSGTGNMTIELNKNKGIINKNPSDTLILNPKPGELGGTPSNPVGQCNNGICVIDYGDFILTSIPEKFGEFVQTSGATGGATKIASALNKIASDLDKAGLTDQANEIKKLATMGHNLALVMAEYEKIVKLCNGNTACINSYENQIMPKPSGYDETYLAFPTNMTYKQLMDSLSLGKAKNLFDNDPSSFQSSLQNNNLAAAYLDQLNSIVGSSGYSDPLKGVISELSWNIGVVSQDFENSLRFLTGQSATYYDPISGTSSIVTPPANAYQAYQSYNASGITNYYSALICSAGSGLDTGTQCH